MFADLKEKAAGVDRKRIYTAVGALVIAGAAGHFMQRTANTGPAILSASVPAPAPITTAPVDPAPQQIAEAPAPVAEPPAAEAPQALAENAPAATPDMAEPMPEAMAEAAPALAPDMAPASTATPEAPVVAMAETPATMPAPAAPEVTRAATDPLMGLAATATTAAAPEMAEPEDLVVAAVTEPDDLAPLTDAAPADPQMAGCDIVVNAEAKPGALLGITIDAPCNSGENVAFDHSGLRFGEQLGPDGTLTIDVPAMAGDAMIAVSFENGTEKRLRLPVPDYEEFDRIALVWQGATGLQLHALEGGASYGEPGHVWADTPGTPLTATSGEGGFISVLGSTVDGFAADVYTYPASLMTLGQEPQVSVEAQVMENTCGGEIDGWILRSNPLKAPNIETLKMVVPGCDAVGDYLVLKDLPIELKLARR
ncbi:MAG: hypothetical protein KDK10_11785 [Maritimibacter sp.]|nr:hypothetical protein [Maritimibacter sp.]